MAKKKKGFPFGIALGILSILISLTAPTVNYFIYTRSASNRRYLDVTTINQIRPLAMLDNPDVHLFLKVGNTIINNPSITQIMMTNTGSIPIQQSDFVEPITFTVPKPWKVVAIVNGITKISQIAGYNTISNEWTQIDDQKFKAKPCLMNPNDTSTTIIFMENSENSTADCPNIEISARILNMPSLYQKTFTQQQLQPSLFGPFVYLQFRDIIAVVVLLALFQICYIGVIMRRGWLHWKLLPIMAIGITSIISVCAAESIVSYISLHPYYELGLQSDFNTFNLPPIILNAVLLSGLFFWPIRTRGKPKETKSTLAET